MNLTAEQMDQGRRNFLRVLAGVPAVATLGVAAGLRGPVPGGPVRIAFIGVGSRGRTLLADVDPAYARSARSATSTRRRSQKADDVLKKNSVPPAKHYSDWKEMLQNEDIEAVIMAPPLWAHADLATGCLEAGKHVLCEKMMAWDEAGCERMRDAAVETAKSWSSGTSATTTRCTSRRTRASSRRAPSARCITCEPPGTATAAGDARETRRHPTSTRHAVGLSDVRSFAELASLLEILAGADGGAVQSSNQCRELVPRIRRRKRSSPPAVLYRFPGRTRGIRPRLRDLRVSGRSKRHVLVDRIERVRRLLRDVPGHEGHADLFCTSRTPCSSTRKQANDRRRSPYRRATAVRSRSRRRPWPATGTPAGRGSPRVYRKQRTAADPHRDSALLFGDPNRKAGGLRSGQGHRVRSPLHPRQRSDQTEDAPHDLTAFRDATTFSSGRYVTISVALWR